MNNIDSIRVSNSTNRIPERNLQNISSRDQAIQNIAGPAWSTLDIVFGVMLVSATIAGVVGVVLVGVEALVSLPLIVGLAAILILNRAHTHAEHKQLKETKERFEAALGICESANLDTHKNAIESSQNMSELNKSVDNAIIALSDLDEKFDKIKIKNLTLNSSKKYLIFNQNQLNKYYYEEGNFEYYKDIILKTFCQAKDCLEGNAVIYKDKKECVNKKLLDG